MRISRRRGKRSETHYTYSANGTLVNHIDRYAGLRYDYTYDSLGRNIVTNIRTTGENDYVGSTVFGYDLRGNVTSIRNEIGGRAYTQTYSYSDVLMLYNYSGEKVVSYEYDAWGNTEKLLEIRLLALV